MFWTLCAVPLLALLLMSEIIGPIWFSAALLLYVVLYRPFLNINRLLQLRAIEERDAWKLFIPFYSARYLRTLWLS